MLWPYWPCGGEAPRLHPKARWAPRVPSPSQCIPMTFQSILPPSRSSLGGMSSIHAGELTPTQLQLLERVLLPQTGQHGTAGYPQPATWRKHHASCMGRTWLQWSQANPTQHRELKPCEPLRDFILHWKHGTTLLLVSSPSVMTGTAPSAVGQE